MLRERDLGGLWKGEGSEEGEGGGRGRDKDFGGGMVFFLSKVLVFGVFARRSPLSVSLWG